MYFDFKRKMDDRHSVAEILVGLSEIIMRRKQPQEYFIARVLMSMRNQSIWKKGLGKKRRVNLGFNKAETTALKELYEKRRGFTSLKERRRLRKSRFSLSKQPVYRCYLRQTFLRENYKWRVFITLFQLKNNYYKNID